MKKPRYLKIIVAICIANLIVFATAAYVSAWFGVDTVPVLQIVAGMFGGELLLTALIEIIKKADPKKPKEEKKANE